jgi:ATP adenylyltransferase/5',5'''-P-1,P-4-tetraphosphate phosphorylase II
LLHRLTTLHHQLITYRSIIGAIFPNLLDVIVLPVPKGATCTISIHKAMTRVQQGKNESPQNEARMNHLKTKPPWIKPSLTL